MSRLALAAVCMLALRGVAAAVLCSTITAPPGAVYLYGDGPTSTSINGNAFEIVGDDHALAGGPGTAPAIFGVAARNDANAQEVRASINAGQTDNIRGRGFVYGNPIIPSIGTVAGPDTAMVGQFVSAILANPHLVVADATITGDVTLGGADAPVVAHLVGLGAGVTIAGTAHVSGFGVLVVDDALTVQGSLTYDGLIVVRGPFTISSDHLTASGNSTIDGSLWTTNLSLTAGGSSITDYSSEAMGLALEAGGAVTCRHPVCGDGVRTEDEECDDGNTADGDCCSATCTVVPADTPCPDDGQVCTIDRCDGAGACVHPNVIDACDDGNACTDGDTCIGTACIGTAVDCGACMQCNAAAGCIAAPALDCREPLVPSLSRLGLTDSEDPWRDMLAWRWRTGDGLERADLGDPLGATGYTICLYGGPSAGSVLLKAVVPAGTGCGTACGWTATSRGFRYRDRLASTGISRIDLAARSPGTGTIRVAGAGEALHMPALPFPISAPLLLQLRAAGGACWQTTYPIGSIGFSGARLSARGAQP